LASENDITNDHVDSFVTILQNTINQSSEAAAFSIFKSLPFDSFSQLELGLLSLSKCKFENVIRENWAFYLSLIEAAQHINKPSVEQSCCIFLASIPDFMKNQIAEMGFFLDFLIPLIASPYSESRYHSRDAIVRLIEVSDTPIPNLVQRVWEVSGKAFQEDDVDSYLRLVSECIDKEGENLSDEISVEMGLWILGDLEIANEDRLIGLLSMGVGLFVCREAVHSILRDSLLKAIENCVCGGNVTLIRRGLLAVKDLGGVLECDVNWVVEYLRHSDKSVVCAAVHAAVASGICVPEIVGIVSEWLGKKSEIKNALFVLPKIAEQMSVKEVVSA
jgi:hypothetical protein